jgi:hypothetical protein
MGHQARQAHQGDVPTSRTDTQNVLLCRDDVRLNCRIECVARAASLCEPACDATGRVLAVDETRHSGGVGDGIVTALVENGFGGRIIRVASRDSYVPLGDAANTVLLSEDDIERAVRRLLS